MEAARYCDHRQRSAKYGSSLPAMRRSRTAGRNAVLIGSELDHRLGAVVSDRRRWRTATGGLGRPAAIRSVLGPAVRLRSVVELVVPGNGSCTERFIQLDDVRSDRVVRAGLLAGELANSDSEHHFVRAVIDTHLDPIGRWLSA